MSNWPVSRGASAFLGADDFDAYVMLPTASGGAQHTDGPWVELVPAARNPGGTMLLCVATDAPLGLTRRHAVTIGIGGAGAEVPLIPNIGVAGASFRYGAMRQHIPLAVPPGQRIAVRTRWGADEGEASIEDPQVRACATIVRNAPVLPVAGARVAHVGFNGAATNGTGVAEGYRHVGSLKGPVVEITGACPFRVTAILPVLWGASIGLYSSPLLRIYGGPGGAEEQIAPPQLLLVGAGAPPAGQVIIPCDIPAGTRLAAQVDGASSGVLWFLSFLLFG